MALGIRDFFGQIRMNAQKIIGLAAGTVATDAARIDQVIGTSGGTVGSKIAWAYISKADGLDPAILGNWTIDPTYSDGVIGLSAITTKSLKLSGLIRKEVMSVVSAIFGNSVGIFLSADVTDTVIVVFKDAAGNSVDLTAGGIGTGFLEFTIMGVLAP